MLESLPKKDWADVAKIERTLNDLIYRYGDVAKIAILTFAAEITAEPNSPIKATFETPNE